MIKAVLYRDGENLTGCRLEGHSGWADSGHDIVCAAASILGCTCVNTLESVCGVIPEITEYNEQKAMLAFELPEMTEEENGKAQILMGALRQGLDDLSAEYPQNVTLSIIERRKQP
ncbi:MAG: ribosomal-processing cysteine protease Prp [Oscillospiraceae bacterium]|nr:ribosomal-processing cysteine protease Prp [Oscillospiraceae bacterium]